MTNEDAQRVAEIALTADGGCSFCGGALIDQLREAFPEHDWYALAKAADDYFEPPKPEPPPPRPWP